MKKNKLKKLSKIQSLPNFTEHEKQQIRFTLRHTTPLQRLKWLEETLQLLFPYLLKNQQKSPSASRYPNFEKTFTLK